MSIPSNSLWRGCAANFPQPVSEEDERAAQCLVETVYYFNCHIASRPVPDIEYRSSSREEDIIRHVFRWDLTPYQQVFQHGFQARRQQGTPDEIYYNLDHYVHHGGRPLDSRRDATHAFVSTTLSSAWHPSLVAPEVYRYEIYAPGGIWVAETLGDRYQYPAQDEVCFVAGIAPQYIRSAQRFRLTADGRYTRRERLDNVIMVNGNFNPQSHPSRLLNIQRPIFDYLDGNGRRALLNLRICRPQREKRQVSTGSDPTDWYAGNVANFKSYIDAAFSSYRSNEAYLFMKNEYVLVDYAPGTTDDRVLNGPLRIGDGYPSLAGTAFAEHGIDCAFASNYADEAYIFSGNLCAKINYAPGTTDDKIKEGPKTIAVMFPFLKKTVFESGIDAAFEATKTASFFKSYEAYLFKGNQYALINYGSDSHLIAIRFITQGFASLKNTIFESGIDAAFASHRTDEAYLFKGDSYALINFAPGTTKDYIIGGVKKILPNWPSLRSILPRNNRGLDVHGHTNADRDHDEL
uniref:Uncharacterized protein LOC105042730 n=1 Tax=Elaeis guineensis var. tenera TaxID=51953 RepID=A0A6I9R0Q3_ELAGV|nr:uncharacterized protein LOC105042730 [Elaeis guineensis]XP_029119721.1 uncharacterized protein LOC105042730 [Elaeis guineensis]